MSTRSAWTRGHPSGEVLSSLVDLEVDPSVRGALDAHLEACADCRARVADFRTLRATLRDASERRPPMSLNRDVWRRIGDHDARSGRGFQFPAFSNPVGVATNALAVAAIAVLVAVIAPGANALLGQLLAPAQPDAALTAAQPTVSPSRPQTSTLPLPTATSAPPTATATALAEPSRAAVVPTPATLAAPPVEARPSQPTARAGPTGAPAVEGPRNPVPTPVAVAPTSTVPVPIATAGAPALRTISGTVSHVDRKSKTITVTSTGTPSDRSWAVVLSDGTQFSRADGRRTTFEDVGIADQVEVSGFETAGQSSPIMASSLRVSVSAVASTMQARAPRILFVVDGAESIRSGQYGLTGDWARRLASTGYEVTTADPARVAWTVATLRGFDLVAIGAPATLGDAALGAIKASHLPILDADPRLVQPLGLGVNVDPANPLRQAPAGRTIDVAASGSIVTRGLATGETVVARELVYRTPIVSNGIVIATVVDAGQRRAVWSQTGTSIYLGAWNSGAGANHTSAYWDMFDRSVVALLGRDPSAGAAATGPAPTPTRAAR